MQSQNQISRQASPNPSPECSRPSPTKRRRTSDAVFNSPSVSPSPTIPQSPSHTDTPLPSTDPTPARWFRRPSVVWYRGHDLRVEDHPALLAAAQRGGPVVPFFVWDPSDGFGKDLGAIKTWWLRQSLQSLSNDLHRLGVKLYMRTGKSTEELRKFLKETGADAVFWNRCYEPPLLTRDEKLRDELTQEGLTAESFKAELLVEPWELTNSDTMPCFQSFHAFMRAWMILPPPPRPLPCPSRLQPISSSVNSVQLDELGLDVDQQIAETLTKVWMPGSHQAFIQLDKFLREVFPAFGEGKCRRHFHGTSRMSPHIRFGEVSPRRIYHTTRLHVLRCRDQASTLHIRASSLKRNRVQTDKPSNDVHMPPPETSDAKLVQTVAKTESPSHDASSPVLRTGSAGRSTSSQRETEPSDESNTESKSPAPTPVYNNPDLHRRSASSGRLPHISLSARAFLKNLCLRDFSYHVLFHNPDFNKKPLVAVFNHFPWANDDGNFDLWRTGRTGYPIVDAAMRELRKTGWVHNGMRFLLACFLTKYLLLPWTRGLKEFYGLLVDGDRSANALGWQWTSGSNTDSFPISLLVNPVKAGYRHDPTGSYVKKWLPELSKLPMKYLHQPWKAPSEVLQKAGVNLGETYPQRIVLLADARKRALNAMGVMKQICISSSVGSINGGLSVVDEKLIKEWPEEESEVMEVDNPASFAGKRGLLPSLWAMLQSEQSSSYLAGNSSGSDPLISMDTVSLTEGALAVPLDEHHESIEHALITANDIGPSTSVLDAAADVECNPRLQPSYVQERHSVSHSILESSHGMNATTADMEDHLKFSSGLTNSFSGTEKQHRGTDLNQPLNTRPQPDGLNSSYPLTQTMPIVSVSNTHSISKPVPRQVSAAQNQVAFYQAHQQLSNFRQLHAQQFHPIQHFHQLHQQQQQQQQQQEQQHQRQHRQQAAQLTPHPQHSSNQPAVPSGLEALYGDVRPTMGLPMTTMPPMHMGTPPMIITPQNGASDLGVNQIFPGSDLQSPVCPPQFGVNPYYSYHQVMPIINPHGANGAERSEVPGPSTTSNGARVALSAMIPMNYGVYSGILDPSVLGSNPIPSNGISYPPMVSSQQTQGTSQAHFNFSPHQMYLGRNHSEVFHPQNVQSGVGAADSSRARVNGHGPSAVSVSNATAAAAAAAVAAGGREVVSSHDRTLNYAVNPSKSRNQRSSPKRKVNSSISKGRRATSSGTAGLSDSSKGVTKTSRSKSSRTRKSTSSSGSGRSRSEKSGTSRRRARSDDRGNSSRKIIQPDNAAVSTVTVQKRREILTSVREEKDHEYYNFANYLAETCELTGNTDRHTSKDYIRLCTLKDAYHRQCTSDEQKLKIYRIKNFFSKILKLEVTGEWDRHNHGGVRGPYVYGIKKRREQETVQG